MCIFTNAWDDPFLFKHYELIILANLVLAQLCTIKHTKLILKIYQLLCQRYWKFFNDFSRFKCILTKARFLFLITLHWIWSWRLMNFGHSWLNGIHGIVKHVRLNAHISKVDIMVFAKYFMLSKCTIWNKNLDLSSIYTSS